MHSPQAQKKKVGDRELIVMMASLMALNALAIDAMLPAFPRMAMGLGLIDTNQIQYIISIYLAGMGLGSIVHGPLSDRYGRRPILLFAIVGYIAFSIACSLASSFEMLLGMRVLQGFCSAALGVLVTSIIRDEFDGDAMARRMSTIFLVFMAVPIVAPLVGSMVLVFAGWRSIFDLLAIAATLVGIWVALRLPETLRPENILHISPASLATAWRKVAMHRSATSYVIAGGATQGALFGYLNSSQQIFDKSFGAADFFPIGFAVIAGGIACANFTNSRIVERFGARRVSHGALFAFIIVASMQLAVSLWYKSNLALFLGLITLNMAMIGFIGSNFSSIAMQPFGAIAGTASSFQMFVRTLVAAGIGAAIGQQFDGNVTPVAAGFLICGLTALALTLMAEQGRLFSRPRTTTHIPLP